MSYASEHACVVSMIACMSKTVVVLLLLGGAALAAVAKDEMIGTASFIR